MLVPNRSARNFMLQSRACGKESYRTSCEKRNEANILKGETCTSTGLDEVVDYNPRLWWMGYHCHPIRRFHYVGQDLSLTGHAAVGFMRDGLFVVQVDCINHPMAFNWHVAIPCDWQQD
jgi:hypothetical protein